MTGVDERATRWASTMTGHQDIAGIELAHADSWAGSGSATQLDRVAREDLETEHLATLATHAHGAGERAVEEEPDPWRTCSERARNRTLPPSAFRPRAGKPRVFVSPDAPQPPRLTHALEVAQVAVSVARALG